MTPDAPYNLPIHLNAVTDFFLNLLKVGKHLRNGDSHSFPAWQVFSFSHLELRAVWGIHHP